VGSIHGENLSSIQEQILCCTPQGEIIGSTGILILIIGGDCGQYSWRESRQYSRIDCVLYTSMRDYLKYFDTSFRRRLQTVIWERFCTVFKERLFEAF
jgi:hypothetical protein